MEKNSSLKNGADKLISSFQRARAVSLALTAFGLFYHICISILFYKIELYPMFAYNIVSICLFVILFFKVPSLQNYIIPYFITLAEVISHQILASYYLGSYCSFHSFILLMGLLPFLVFEDKYQLSYPIIIFTTGLYIIFCCLDLPPQFETSQHILYCIRVINVSITAFMIVFMILIYTRLVFNIEKNLQTHYNALESELKMAAVIQQGFFKHDVQYINNYEVAFFSHPMVEVSGDLIDFYKTSEHLDGLGIFDVSGHGISSGMVTMLVKNIIHQEFYNNSNLELWEVLNKINDRVIKEKGEIQNYLTGILARTFDNKIELVSAGHPLPIYYKKKTGECSYLDSNKESIGVIGIAGFPTFFQSHIIDFEDGDELIFYSDGVVDIKNSENEYYGKKRLLETVKANLEESASAQAKLISKNIYNFCGKREQNDDLTVIVLKK